MQSQRLHVEVLPSLLSVAHSDYCTQIFVHNSSDQRRTIGKGTRIANGTTGSDVVLTPKITKPETITSIDTPLVTPPDPIDKLCSKFQHLSHAELGTARSLLEQYRDVFSVSNDKIGRTDIIYFDLDPTDVRPVAVPLRHVPLHHRHVVTELLEHYQ